MLKSQALQLLGGTIAAAAEAIGISYQAVDKWPDELPARIADRVQAALWRKQHGLSPLVEGRQPKDEHARACEPRLTQAEIDRQLWGTAAPPVPPRSPGRRSNDHANGSKER